MNDPISITTYSNKRATGMPGFVTIWLGEMVSVIGSSLSDFALSIWVYTTTGSVMQFSIMMLAFALPRLLIAPVAGMIVDRFNRRSVMLFSDMAHAVLMGSVMVLLHFNLLVPWHLYVIAALSAIASAFQMPAYQAIIPQLVDEAQLGRANGMVNLADGVAQLLGPLLGGVLLGLIGLSGIVLIDLLTFAVAALALVLVRVPNVAAIKSHDLSHEANGTDDFRDDFRTGWRFIAQRPALLQLMIYIAATVFLTSFVQVLTPPLVLSFTTEAMLGVILAVGGIGMLAGGLLMSVWGGPKRRVYGLLLFDVVTALALILAGVLSTPWWFAVAAFFFFFSMPISRGSAQSIWQSVVPQPLQGRVFSARDMIAIAASPIAILLAGPLADGVFAPYVETQSGWLSAWFGNGHGIGLMFVLLGVLLILVNGIAWASPILRRVGEATSAQASTPCAPK